MTTAATELAAGGPAQDDAPASSRRRDGGGLGSYLLVRFLLGCGCVLGAMLIQCRLNSLPLSLCGGIPLFSSNPG